MMAAETEVATGNASQQQLAWSTMHLCLKVCALPQEHTSTGCQAMGCMWGEKHLSALHHQVRTCLSCFKACLPLFCSSSSGSMPAAAAACHSRLRAPLQAQKHTISIEAGLEAMTSGCEGRGQLRLEVQAQKGLILITNSVKTNRWAMGGAGSEHAHLC